MIAKKSEYEKILFFATYYERRYNMNNDYLKEQLANFNEKTSLKELQKYINDMIEIRGFSRTNTRRSNAIFNRRNGRTSKGSKKTKKI